MHPDYKKPPGKLLGRTIDSVYLAGKISGDDWRDQILVKYKGNWSGDEHGVIRNLDNQDIWETVPRAIDAGNNAILGYSGPFWRPLGYGGGHGSVRSDSGGLHECGELDENSNFHASSILSIPRKIFGNIMSALSRSDLVFAWIDGLDCLGTIYEIGAAVMMGKTVVIASPGSFDERELWIAFTGATRVIRADSPAEAWSILWKTPNQSGGGQWSYSDPDHLSDQYEDRETEMQGDPRRRGEPSFESEDFAFPEFTPTGA